MDNTINPPAPESPKQKNNLAVWSMVLAILSIVLFCLCAGPFLGVPAVICGHIALSKIKQSNGTMNGSGMAIAGLVMGYIAIGLTLVIIPIQSGILLPALGRAREQARRINCLGNIKQIAIACQIYEQDYNCYPDKLSSLYPEYTTSFLIFTCPSTNDIVTDKESIDSNTSYFYSPETANSGQKDVPFIADKNLKNHHDDGANCAYINGDAKWIPKKDIDFLKK